MAERAHPNDPAFQGTIYETRLRERYTACQPHIQGRDVLDVPCGTGWGSSLLSGYASLTGLDISGEAIAFAREHYPGITFVEGPMQVLPFDGARFDVVICLEGLEHIYLSDARRFLAEAWRVLRPDGILIVTAPLLNSGHHSGNPFHLYEFEQHELVELLSRQFEPQLIEAFEAGDGPELRFVGRRRAAPQASEPMPAQLEIYRRVADWIESLYQEPGYRYAADTPVTLIGTACAVLSLEGLGELGRISPTRRQALVSYLQSSQDAATGLFHDPLLEQYPVTSAHHDEEYVLLQMSYFALVALDALGVAPLYALGFVDRFQTSQAIQEWLDSLDWSNAWLQSNRVMFVLAALVQRAERERQAHHVGLLHSILDWLDAHQDPRTGVWGTQHGASLLNGMAAAYHFVPFYEYVRRPVRGLNALIDSTLALQQSDRMFGAGLGGGACEDLDAVGVLAVASIYTSHRKEEVRQALVQAFWAMLSTHNADGGFCYTRRSDSATYAFSSWEPLTVELRASDVWATWSRLITFGTIAQLAAGDLPTLPEWKFRRWPGLGYQRFDLEVMPEQHETLAFWRRSLPTAVPSGAEPLVSVIVPCYNLGVYLHEALASLLTQTLQPIEVIVVDDGSNDPYTQLVLGRLDHPQVQVQRLKNEGVARARNTGIRLGKAPYICCLDADDQLRPPFLEKALAVLESNSQIGFVSAFYEEFDGRHAQVRHLSCNLPEMLVTNHAMVASLFRREAWAKAGGYSEALSGLHDWDLWIGMLEAGFQGSVVPEVLFDYRVRPGSMYTVSSRPENYARLIGQIVERHRNLYQIWLSDVLRGWAEEFALVVDYASGQAKLVQQLRPLADRGGFAEQRAIQAEQMLNGLMAEVANWRGIADQRQAWIGQLEAARSYYIQQVENWQVEVEHLGRLTDVLRSERDALMIGRDTLRSERDALVIERDTLRSERDALVIERDTFLEHRLRVMLKKVRAWFRTLRNSQHVRS